MGAKTFATNNATALGYLTSARGAASTALGYSTLASGSYSTALGYDTEARAAYSTALGYSTFASSNYSIAMGYRTTASGLCSTAMGNDSTAEGSYSTALGDNTYAYGDGSLAGGDWCNAFGNFSIAYGSYAGAGGYAAVALGDGTVAHGNASVALGSGTWAGGHVSTALGWYAQAPNNGAFVWSDWSGDGYPYATSVSSNSVTFRASGGYRLFSNPAMTSGVSLAPGATAWAVISDRNAKKDLAPVDSVGILEKQAAMPVTQWHYNWESADTTPHIGPMAQDFKAAFYPGTDDKSITTLEADGVALAAIQGLNQKLEHEVKAKDAQIESLKQSVAELRRLVETLAEKK